MARQRQGGEREEANKRGDCCNRVSGQMLHPRIVPVRQSASKRGIFLLCVNDRARLSRRRCNIIRPPLPLSKGSSSQLARLAVWLGLRSERGAFLLQTGGALPSQPRSNPFSFSSQRSSCWAQQQQHLCSVAIGVKTEEAPTGNITMQGRGQDECPPAQ